MVLASLQRERRRDGEDLGALSSQDRMNLGEPG